ncbi:MAG: hypothetical protein ACE5GT_09965, partial [Rhodospirillales bacterium]
MTGSFACLSRLRPVPWSIAVLLLLAGCQSSQIPPWLQDGSTARPQATRPPSEATRVPQPGPLPGAPAQAYPPVAGPRLPKAPEYPPGRVPRAPVPAPREGEAAAPPDAQPELPSFAPYLTRPPKDAKPAARPRAPVPPPASADTVRVAL